MRPLIDAGSGAATLPSSRSMRATTVVDRLARASQRLDARRFARRGERSAGAIAKVWATLKVLIALPITVPATVVGGWRATINHLRAKDTMAELPGVIAALDRGGDLPDGWGRLRRLDA